MLLLDKLKKSLTKKNNGRIIENIFSLSFLQISNYIFPLITLPYLTRVLGPEKFGLTAFALAVMQYFVIFTDFGFNLSATREVSINRSDYKKISQIFASVFTIKIFLLVLSSVILIGLISFFSIFKVEQHLYVYTFLSVFGWVLFPQWLYQGIEKMKFITIFSIITRILFTISIFFIIKSETDYLWLPLLNSFSYILTGLIGFIYSFKVIKLTLVFPKIDEIKSQFFKGFYIFLSNLSVNLYTTSNSVLLGLLTNNTVVGYYSAAERIFRAFQYLGMPIYQALFPHMSKLFIEDRNRAIYIFSKMFKMTILITAVLSLVLSISSPLFIPIIVGKTFYQSITIFALLSWILVSSWGNYTLGIQGLVNFGYEKIFSKIVIIFGVIHIIVLSIAIEYFGVIAVPIIWFLTESMIFLVEFRILKQNKLLVL